MVPGLGPDLGPGLGLGSRPGLGPLPGSKMFNKYLINLMQKMLIIEVPVVILAS